MTTFADVEAGVRAAVAAYAQALDDGRADDVVATFCVDGGCDIPGLGAFDGHDALRGAYAGWQPPVALRHLVTNTLVTSWDEDEAHATSDVVVIAQGEKGWSIQVVGRYHDVLHRDRDTSTWRFHRRTAEFL